MNKKGFTLIELLGVVVILSVIGLITVPVVQNSISNNAKKTCQNQIKLFEKAAKNYVANNPYIDTSVVKSVTIKKLIDEGYLDSNNLDNPKGGTFSKNSKILIEYTSSGNNKGSFNFKYEKDTSSSEKDCED